MPRAEPVAVLDLTAGRNPVRTPAPRRRKRRLPESARRVLQDRIESAVAEGRVSLVETPREVAVADGPAVTNATLAALLDAMFPEDYRSRPATGRSDHPPGSEGRVGDYVARRERGEDLFSRRDAETLDDDRRSVVVGPRGNGKGVVVQGWAEQPE